ncbi:hypothetical protein HPB47_021518 [Ixodes persulcatus]|uniref:Uncharacterized protein n=1 Tax=Ixodes persulcatus TaxID=34615 RepID=A0AC60QCB1_IXOPE|nr:hypothetical protein HPB47_021518 [Ixodes persulcatus]
MVRRLRVKHGVAGRSTQPQLVCVHGSPKTAAGASEGVQSTYITEHLHWDRFPEIPSEERWEASLRSPDPDLQVRPVKRAKEVAGRPRPTATTGPPT